MADLIEMSKAGLMITVLKQWSISSIAGITSARFGVEREKKSVASLRIYKPVL
jgi:hypothetical protein